MKKLALAGLVTIPLLSGLAGYFARTVMSEEKPPLIHKLKAPLMLAGGSVSKHNYLLPPGTTLYYDRAYPEGFVRYKIYVNVEGTLLDVAPPTEKFWLDPLVAFPVGKEQLKKLLESYPISKEELREILDSGTLSKEEIRQLLEEFAK